MCPKPSENSMALSQPSFIYLFNISSFYIERRVEFFFLETKLMGLKIDTKAIIRWRSGSEEGSTLNECCFISIKSLYQDEIFKELPELQRLTLLLAYVWQMFISEFLAPGQG